MLREPVNEYIVYQAWIEQKAAVGGEDIESYKRRVNRRFEITLESSQDSWRYHTYTYLITPKHGRVATLEERARGDADRLAFMRKYPPKHIEKVYPNITGCHGYVMDSARHAWRYDVTSTPGMVYRGMSYEEWEYIKREQCVRSHGWYNLGQESLTLFGSDIETAIHYASGFAPWPYSAGWTCPGMIIGIPRELTLGHSDDPKNISDGERAIRGCLEVRQFLLGYQPFELWAVIPTSHEQGYIEVNIDDMGKITEGSGNLAGPSCCTLRVPPARIMEWRAPRA